MHLPRYERYILRWCRSRRPSKNKPSSRAALLVRFRPHHRTHGALTSPDQKAVVCSVPGYAAAGGLELSLLRDICVAEEDAVFGVFCRRSGVLLIDGGTVRLQTTIGLGRAIDLILTGGEVSAQEALIIGLANRIVPKGKAVEEAIKIAEMLAKFPQLCMNKDRESCYCATYQVNSFADALKFEFHNGKVVIEKEGLDDAIRFSEGQGRSSKL